MYFWNIKELKKELKKRSLSERESFKYLIASMLFYAFDAFLILDSNIWDVISALIATVILICGTYYVYKCNDGEEGSNFLQRYVALGWVVAIRWLVMIVLPATIVYFIILEIFTGITYSTTLSDVIFYNILFIVYFFILCRHITDIAGKD